MPWLQSLPGPAARQRGLGMSACAILIMIVIHIYGSHGIVHRELHTTGMVFEPLEVVKTNLSTDGATSTRREREI